MKRSPARLVIALSVAAVLAIFILYTSIAGAGTPEIGPSTVGRHAGEDVLLVGTVVGHVAGDAHAGGMRFLLNKRRVHRPSLVEIPDELVQTILPPTTPEPSRCNIPGRQNAHLAVHKRLTHHWI